MPSLSRVPTPDMNTTRAFVLKFKLTHGLGRRLSGRSGAVLGSRLPHAGARCNFKRSCLLFLTSRPKRATGRLRSLAVCMLLANCVSGDTVHDTAP